MTINWTTVWSVVVALLIVSVLAWFLTGRKAAT